MGRASREECFLCHRHRWGMRLSVSLIEALGDGTHEDHYRLTCTGGCKPTRIEGLRERWAEMKARRDIARWVNDKEGKT